MHVNIAARHERQVQGPAETAQAVEATPILALAEHLRGDPESVGEALREPLPFAHRRRCVGIGAGNPQDEAVREQRLHIDAIERVAALLRDAPASSDEAAQAAVALPIRSERHETQAAGQAELCADDELDGAPLFLLALDLQERADDAGDGTFVRDGDGRVAELAGTLDELFRMRGAFQERKVAEAMQLGIAGLRGGGRNHGSGKGRRPVMQRISGW